MVRKIFGSTHIPHNQKTECFAALAKLDSSDMLKRTEVYCAAATPTLEAKRAAFLKLFTSDDQEGAEPMSLQEMQETCRGFCQFGQRDLIATFSDDFFERIENCVNTRSWSTTRYIYHFLAPGMKATQQELDKFNALLTKLQAYGEAEKKEGTGRLIKWLKDSIKEIQEKRAGRELSQTWEDNQRPALI